MPSGSILSLHRCRGPSCPLETSKCSSVLRDWVNTEGAAAGSPVSCEGPLCLWSTVACQPPGPRLVGASRMLRCRAGESAGGPPALGPPALGFFQMDNLCLQAVLEVSGPDLREEVAWGGLGGGHLCCLHLISLRSVLDGNSGFCCQLGLWLY